MRLLSFLAVTSAMVLPMAASAAPMDVFSLTGNGLDLSFTIAASPVPSTSYADLGFLVNGVKVTANGKSYTARPADFFIDDVGGGFALQDDDDLIQYFSFSGPQLYTGGVKTPTFTLGNYNVQAVFCPGQDPEGPQTCSSLPTYSLAITPQIAATPEPSSLALLGTGLLSGVAVVRRRLSLA